MKRWNMFLGMLLFVGLFWFGANTSAEENRSDVCNRQKQAFCFEKQLVNRIDVINGVNLPKIATPDWMASIETAPVTRTVSYVVSTKGAITSDLAEFKQIAAETFNNPSGWARLGVSFVPVDSGGDFTLWLAQDSEVPSFSPNGCDSTYSCAVGSDVIINQTRWQNGSDSWNTAGSSLYDYRRMVLNHETGHWLGHGHRYCSGAGQLAPVMQQQSMDMQGCSPNPWPLTHELTSSRLGIRS